MLDKKNRKVIKEFVKAENDEYKAFEARINLIEDAEVYQRIKQHIYDIKAKDFNEKEQNKFEFPWNGMTDEEFAQWVTGGQHDSYILRILTEGEDVAPSEALTARIADIQDEELINSIYNYLIELGLTEFEAKLEKNPDDEIEEEVKEETEEKTEEEITEEIPEEEIEEETKTTYVWDGLSDEELIEWLLSEGNLQYIKDVFSGKTSEELEAEYPEQNVSEKDSLWERIEKISDAEVVVKVKEFINGLKPELEKIVLKNEEYNVTVEGELPEGAQLQVTPVSFETLNEYVEEGQKIICAYDITILVNGEEYQPENPLDVTLGEIEKAEKITEIKHIHKDKKTGNKKIEKIKPEKGKKLSFKAKKFSIYMALAQEFTENDKVTVHFDANIPNGGTCDVVGTPMDSFEYVLGSEAVAIPCHFFTAGYGFLNWNTKPDGTGKYYNDFFESVDETLIGTEITLYAQWDDTIYFDINANLPNSPIQGGSKGIRVNSQDYRGYVWEYKLDETDKIIEAKLREIAGKHYPENNYYVYYTTQQVDNLKIERYGRYILANGKVEYRLVEYNPVMVKEGDKEIPWREYITNHPMNKGADFVSDQLGFPDVIEKFHKSAHYDYKTTNGSNRVNGAAHGNFIVGTKITRPEESAAGDGKDASGDSYYDESEIIESDYVFANNLSQAEYGNVGNVNIIYDNIWVSWHRASKGYVDKSTGPLNIEFIHEDIKNNTVRLKLIGDNRMGNINYSTVGKDTGNKFIIEEYKKGSGATLTLGNAYTDEENDNNWMDTALGSREGYSCDGLVIESGNIYVGTSSEDMATAIGAGAGPEGYTNITINGGTVTAVSNSGGAAIGGGAGYVITNDSDYGPNFKEKIVNYGNAGVAEITIKNGAKVYAYNGGSAEMKGVSIGGGSALENNGGSANITIEEGAEVIAGSIGGGKTYRPDEFEGGKTLINYEPKTVKAQFYVPENAPESEINVPDGVVFNGAGLLDTDLTYVEPNGGAINLGDGLINLTNATIKNYTVSGYGGGIYVKDGTINLPDIQLFNNEAKYGGAIAVDANENTTGANITLGYNEEHLGGVLNALNYTHSKCPAIYNNTATEDAGAIYFKANENTNFNIYCLNEYDNSAEGEYVYHESDFLRTTGSGGTFVLDPKGQITINNSLYVDGSNVTINGTMQNPLIEDYIAVDIEGKNDCSFNDKRAINDQFTKIKLVENYTGERPPHVQNISPTKFKIKTLPVGGLYTFKKDVYTIPGKGIIGWHKDKIKDPEQAFDYPNNTEYQAENPESQSDYLTVYAIWEDVITYVWDGTTDEEFVEWVYDEDNVQSIIDVINGLTPDEVVVKQNPDAIPAKDSLLERVESIVDPYVREAVEAYINSLGKELEKMTLRDDEFDVVVEGYFPAGTELRVKLIPSDGFSGYVDDGLTIDRAYNITLWVDGVQYHPTKPVDIHLNDVRLPEKIIKVKNIYKDKITGAIKAEEVEHEGKVRLSFTSTNLQDFILLRKEFASDQKVTVVFNMNLPDDFPDDAQYVTQGTMDSFDYVLGEERVPVPCHYYIEGYGFLNWNTAADGSGTYFNDYFETVDTDFVQQGIVTLYAQWDNTIYFDFGANRAESPIASGARGIRINKYDYRGYVCEYREDENGDFISYKVREIAGRHFPGNKYYTYMNKLTPYVLTKNKVHGRIIRPNGKVEYVLPEYNEIVETSTGLLWGEYITNHPERISEDVLKNELGVDNVSKAFADSVKNVRYRLPYSNIVIGTSTLIVRPTEEDEYTYIKNDIIESDYVFFSNAQDRTRGNVGNVNMVIDNLWTGHHRPIKEYDARTTGPIQIEFIYPENTDNTVNISLVGDSRIGNLGYSTVGDDKNNKLVIDEYEEGSGATLTITNEVDEKDTNWMDAPLGSREGYSCDGLDIEGGIIYVGTTSGDEATAIGAGAGSTGYANITINGGTVTAVSNSGGAAIGGGPGYNIENVFENGVLAGKNVAYADAGGAKITIGKNAKVYAYNGGAAKLNDAELPAPKLDINDYEKINGVSIGGGSSYNNNGGDAIINIEDGATVVAGSIGGGKTYKPDEFEGGKTLINYEPKTVKAQFYVPENAPESVITVPDGVTFDGEELINTDLIYIEPNGGAINLGDGSINLTNATIQNYTVSGYGGGIYVKDGTINLPDIYLLNNKAKYGGAIAVDANENTTDANITIGYNVEHTGGILNALNYTHSRCPLIQGNIASEEAGGIYYKANENTDFSVYCLNEYNNSAEGEFIYHESDFFKTTGSGGSFVFDPYGPITINDASYVDGAKVTIRENRQNVQNQQINNYITVDIEGKDNCQYTDERKIVGSGFTKIKLIDNFNEERPSYVLGSPTRYKVITLPVGEKYTFTNKVYTIPGAVILGWHKEPVKKAEDEFNHPLETQYEAPAPTTEDDYLKVYAIWDERIYQIQFDPNWPTDDLTGTEGSMSNMILNYGQKYTLNKNTYNHPVWHFLYWNTEADGTGETIKDGQEVYNLTDKNGETVKLYAQWSEYIYFDYNANATKTSYDRLEGPTYAGSSYRILIENNTYTGYIFSTTTDENGVEHTVIKEVTGTHRPGNKYYIYASSRTNYFKTGEVNGQIVLPKYKRVTTKDGQPWDEFITNNTDLTSVFDTWYSVYSKSIPSSTSGNMRIKGNVGDVTIVLDSLYSHTHWSTAKADNTGHLQRTAAPIFVDFDDSNKIKDNTVRILLKGDNRMGNIHYSTYTLDANEDVVQDTNNHLIIDALEGEDNPTLTLGNRATSSVSSADDKANFFASALGSDTSHNQCSGIEIKGGIIYAGTNANDFATAIGAGGNGSSKIKISGGTVTAISHSQGAAIGGGIGGKSTKAGSTEVTIEGGTIYAYNFGNKNANHVSQLTDKQNYITGAAIGSGSGIGSGAGATSNVIITGGNVYAQSIGGTAIGGGASINGSAYLADVEITGGTVIAKSLPGIINNTEVPAGIGIGGGKGGLAGHGGNAKIAISGDAVVKTGSIGGNITTNAKGYTGDSTINITSGTVTGQIALMDGTKNESVFNLKGGTLTGSDTSSEEFVTLYKDGGAIYIDNPKAKVNITGGNITNSKANNGGAIAALGGTVIMSAGEISSNTAENAGGAIYVSSVENNAAVDILSGTLRNNTAQKGGAVALVDAKDNANTTDVVIGVDQSHSNMPFEHTYKATLYNHSLCPVMENNSAKDGGAIYIDGNDTNTKLSIYCLEQSDEQAGEHSFIRMDGGNCIVSAENDNGNISIDGSSYINGGTMNLIGSMANPTAKDYFTVEPTGTFNDNRPDKDQYGSKIRYIENFEGSEKYKAIDISKGDTVSIPDSIFPHTGYHIANWNTANDNSAERYENNSIYDPENFTVDDYLKLYAIWDINKYHIAFDVNLPLGIIYQGTMESMNNCEYNREYILNGNTYSAIGYIFTGWNTAPDGSGTKISNGATVKNLSLVHDETVTLYAQWNSHSGSSGGGTGGGSGGPSNPDPDNPDPDNPDPDNPDPDNPDPDNPDPDNPDPDNPDPDNPDPDNPDPDNPDPDNPDPDNPDPDNPDPDNPDPDNPDPDNPDPDNPDPDNPDPDNPDEPEEEENLHVYSYSTEGSTIIRTCSCGIVNRAKLSATDVVYNGEVQNTVEVSYTTNAADYVWTPEVSYENPNPVNAGTYSASISEGGKTVTVTFTIRKADQSAPSAPEFTENKAEGSTTITVSPIQESAGESLYRVIYYNADQIWQTEWSTSTEIVIENEYKKCYVEAKYGETANYNESPVTASTEGYIAGKLRVEIIADDGVNYEISHTNNSITVAYEIDNDYYKTNDFVGKASVVDGDKPEIQDNGTKFIVTNIPNEGVILVSITGVKKIATVVTKSAEGEVFGLVDGNSPAISRDSAFTASFEISDYVVGDYGEIKLGFDRALPEKTTIILMDKESEYASYWYYEANTSVKDIPLAEFRKMGGEELFSGLSSGDYQFIVNFEKTVNGCSGSSISMNLSADAENGQPQNLEANVTVALADISHSMTLEETNELSATLNLVYNKTEFASKWENRRTSLILIPKNVMPFDAKIRITKGIGNNQTIVERNSTTNGMFIIPIGYLMSDVVEIELISEAFPDEQMEYSFICDWIVSESLSGISSFNGEKVATINVTFIKPESKVPSVKLISSQGERKIYKPGETIIVDAHFKNVAVGNSVKATLMIKNANGEYESIETQNLIEEGEVSMTVGNQPGSYCIFLEIVDSEGNTVVKTPYYFVVCE